MREREEREGEAWREREKSKKAGVSRVHRIGLRRAESKRREGKATDGVDRLSTTRAVLERVCVCVP